MIEAHMWSGWFEPTKEGGPPQYGTCQTIVHGVTCGQPRHEHRRLGTAHPRERGEQ